METEGIWHAVPDRTQTFVGREKELSQIQDMIGQPLVLCGPTGIGKSEIAIKHCNDFSEVYDNNVMWINAETQSSCVLSFIGIAKQLKLINGDEESEEIVSKLFDCFRRQGKKAVLVFDNVGLPLDVLQDYLPTNKSPTDILLQVLITSRVTQWKLPTIHIDVFPLQDAQRFLQAQRSYSESIDPDSLTKLASNLKCSPLALQMCASYLNSQKITSDEYTRLFQDKVNHYFTNSLLNYEKTVVTAVRINIDVLKQSSLSLRLLHLCSFFNGESINTELFFNLDNVKSMDVKMALAEIAELGLLKKQSGNVMMHARTRKVNRW